MPSTNTPKQTPTFDHTSAVHQPFDWIDPGVKDYPMADFVSLVRDASAGIQTCLEIINSSDLERKANVDAEPGEEALPAVTSHDAENLLRLSIATSKLLLDRAEQKINWLNEHGAEHLQSMKGGAK